MHVSDVLVSTEEGPDRAQQQDKDGISGVIPNTTGDGAVNGNAMPYLGEWSAADVGGGDVGGGDWGGTGTFKSHILLYDTHFFFLKMSDWFAIHVYLTPTRSLTIITDFTL